MSTAFDTRKSEFTDLGYEIKNLETKINLYENSQCPTCGSDLHTDEHHSLKEQAISDRDVKKSEFETLKEELRTSQSKIYI